MLEVVKLVLDSDFGYFGGGAHISYRNKLGRTCFAMVATRDLLNYKEMD